MNCLEIKHHQIYGIPPNETLATIPWEDAMLIDYDAIISGKPDFKLYDSISKFLEIVVFNLSYRVDDVIDSMISGASKVVIDSQSSEDTIDKLLNISGDIVLPASRIDVAYSFTRNGGKYFISNGPIPYDFELCYNVGVALSNDKYVDVKDFPQDLIHFI